MIKLNYMKNIILVLFTLLFLTPSYGQEEEKKNIFKTLYTDFLKYGTVYGAGDISNSIEAAERTYFVRTGESQSLYDIPVIAVSYTHLTLPTNREV